MSHMFLSKKSSLFLLCSLLFAPTFEQKADGDKGAWALGLVTVIGGGYCIYKYKSATRGSKTTVQPTAPIKKHISRAEYEAAQQKLIDLAPLQEKHDTLLAQQKELLNSWNRIGTTIEQLENNRKFTNEVEDKLCHPCRSFGTRVAEYGDPANTKSGISYVSEYFNDRKLCNQLKAVVNDLHNKHSQTMVDLHALLEKPALFAHEQRTAGLQTICTDEYTSASGDVNKLRMWREKYQALAQKALSDAIAAQDRQLAERAHAQEVVAQYEAEQADHQSVNN